MPKIKDKQKNPLFYCLIFLIFLTSAACRRNATISDGRPDIQLSILRFDLSLSNLDTENALEKHIMWKNEYGIFYRDYIEKVLAIGPVDEDEEIAAILSHISQTEDFHMLKEEVQKVFKDLSVEEERLSHAFGHIKHELPKTVIPTQIITYFSGFAVQTAIGEDYIGIGLDMFLGDSPFYPSLIGQYPQYIYEKFTPENIVPRVLEVFIREEIMPEDQLEGSFLAHMLHHGKVLYLMDTFLPETDDHLKIGYTKQQIDWAMRYQSSIWDWVLMEELLYQTDYLAIQKHFNNAPFTPQLGDRDESAPKLGVFLGWNMVRKYMKEYPETSLQKLLAMGNEQVFLTQSGYKGR